MDGAIIEEERLIPVDKIVSAACKNYMAFDGLHRFEFKDGINTIIGGNASGKTSLVWMILQALSINDSHERIRSWNPYRNGHGTSLIELKFLAGGKEHYIRRVMQDHDHTTDIHLYVGNQEPREFYRDHDAIRYLKTLEPVFVVDGLEASRESFYVWKRNNKSYSYNSKNQSDNLISQMNEYISTLNESLKGILLQGNEVVCEYKDGRILPLTHLSGGNARAIFVIGKILSIINMIEEEGKSKVILVDEIELGLDKKIMKKIYHTIKEIANNHGYQFFVTSRFGIGRINPLRVNRFSVPVIYRRERTQKQIFGNPPFFSVKSTTNKFRNIQWGNSKWKP